MGSEMCIRDRPNFVNYVKDGGATLIFDDPCPMIFRSQFGLSMAPRLPKPSPGGGGMMGMQRPPQAEPKADGGKLTTLTRALGIKWDNGRSAFDLSNPHPEFSTVPEQIVFVTRSNGNKNAFDTNSEITSGLQEVVALWPGEVQEIEGRTDIKFEKLLQTGANSGALEWDQYMDCLLYTSPSPRDLSTSRMPSSA